MSDTLIQLKPSRQKLRLPGEVEYAMEAINLAGSTVGVLAEDGVILAGEKKTTSKLLDQATIPWMEVMKKSCSSW